MTNSYKMTGLYDDQFEVSIDFLCFLSFNKSLIEIFFMTKKARTFLNLVNFITCICFTFFLLKVSLN